MATAVKALLFLLLLTYFFIFYAFHFNLFGEEGFVNDTMRPFFIKNKALKQAYMLNSYGDMRYEYVGKERPNVFVEIDYQTGYEPYEEAETWVKDMINELLEKNSEVTIEEDDNIFDLDSFTDDQLKKMASRTRTTDMPDDSVYLHIIYVSESESEPTNSAWVISEDTIFVFKKTINSLSEEEEIRKRLEESTIKHEFGHLLGFTHLERENCIMSETVEVFGNFKYQANNIPLDYCGETLVKLEELKSEVL